MNFFFLTLTKCYSKTVHNFYSLLSHSRGTMGDSFILYANYQILQCQAILKFLVAHFFLVYMVLLSWFDSDSAYLKSILVTKYYPCRFCPPTDLRVNQLAHITTAVLIHQQLIKNFHNKVTFNLLLCNQISLGQNLWKRSKINV